MKLTVLVDNNTLIDRYFCGEPGASYLIEEGNYKILFDVGYSEMFIRNAQKMGIDLLKLDFVVLSHGHLDHTWGLDPLIRLYMEATIEGRTHKTPTIIAHPEVFLTKRIEILGDIGSAISEKKLSEHFPLKLNEKPVWLTDRLVYLGKIERNNDFEGQVPIGKVVRNGHEKDDFLMDDSALAYKSPEGLVIITGCSHAGICNIVKQAKTICKDERVIDIVGGLHLLEPSERQMKGTLKYLKKIKPKKVHACHCTDLKSKIALSNFVNVQEVGVGLKIEYN